MLRSTGPRVTLRRLLLVGTLMTAGLVAAAPPAAADFHLMVVQEVWAGAMTDPSADLVQLRMTATGQGNVSGHILHLYNGNDRYDCPVPADVPNEGLNDRILFATSGAETIGAFTADFRIPPLLDGAAGAVCWENVDCVSWGSFSGETTSPAGAPFPGGITPNESIQRTGDTNNSAADFTASPWGAPPQSNPVVTPGSMTCQPFTPPSPEPDLQNLKAKVKGGRATISGAIQPPAPGDKVSLTFFANGSPLRKVAKKSATLDADSKFKKRFKVPEDSTRCKVKVAFHGNTLAQKKFKC